MTIWIQPNKIFSLSAAFKLLAQKLKDCPKSAFRHSPGTARRAVPVMTFRVKIRPPDFISWLNAQKQKDLFYFADRDQRHEFAALGHILRLKIRQGGEGKQVLKSLKHFLNSIDQDTHLFGGLCFDPRNLGRQWQELGSFQFFLPRLEIHRQENDCVLICHIRTANAMKELRTALKIIEHIVPIRPIRDQEIIVDRRRDKPPLPVWANKVKKIIKNIEQGNLEKVVLARQTRFTGRKIINPWQLLNKIKDQTPDCYHFCFCPNPQMAFLGASPERLFRRYDRKIETEALAGTRPRGATAEENTTLRKELLRSDKDILEHGMVVKDIKEKLEALCHSVKMEPKSKILELNDGNHLRTQATGILKRGRGDQDLWLGLHPTAAVAGLPFKKSIKIIKEFEPFKRGWYAGAIGWMSRQQSEFAVGIRSAWVSGRKLYIYAGAGIVRGSQAAMEWQEVENKINNFLEVLIYDHSKSP